MRCTAGNDPIADESAGKHACHAPVDAQREFRSVRGSAEGVERVAERQRRRVDDVERATVETLEVRDVVDRFRDKVDRDKVERPALGADERRPLREGVAHLLDELERVIRTVDAIRLAGLRRADDHAGAIDAPGHRGLGAHDVLGLVLRLVVGVVELLALVEHRLGEGPLVPPGDGDRAHQMEAAGADLVREADDVARAGDIGALGLVGRRRQVVDGREMEHLSAAELLAIIDGQGKAGLAEIADQRMQPFAAWIEALALSAAISGA